MKRVTSIDVAKLAGVSQSAVSQILNNKSNTSFSQETVNKVIEAANQLNYKLNLISSVNKRERNHLIAVIVPTMSNPYYPLLAQAIEENVVANGYNVILLNTQRNVNTEKYYLELCSNKLVDGLIYCFTPSSPQLIQSVNQTLPVVIVGEKDDSLNIDTIGLNSYKSGMLVAEHLVNLGHKDIAFVSPQVNRTSYSRRKRLNGVIDKLKESNLEKNLVTKIYNEEQESISEGAFDLNVGFELTNRIINENKVTAIIAVCDMVACGVLKALNKNRIKVPDEISVCSFDNIFTSSIVTPNLTTIDHCIQHRSKVAVDIILEKVENSNKLNFSHIDDYQSVYKIEYEPQLIIRESTAAVLNKEK